MLLGGLAILALVLGGLLAWWHVRPRIPAEDLEGFLDRNVGGGLVQFSVVRSSELRLGDSDLQVTFAATARSLMPLYSRVDSSGYLRRTFQIDPDLTGAAHLLLSGSGSVQNPVLAGAGPIPADPYDTTILRLDSPGGAPFSFRGVLAAHRAAGAWSLSLVSGSFDGAAPQGRPRSAFGDNSFEAADPGDEAKLRALASDFQAFAARVAKAQGDIRAAKAAEIARRRDAFLAEISPGSVLRGTALEAGSQIGTPLYLEITGLSRDDQVTALLRNDGGWSAARAFQGAWSSDEDLENPVLNLTSSPEQAVRNGGPFLENTQVWTLALRADPTGGLSERNGTVQYQFQPIGPDQASALRLRLEAEFRSSVAATQPDQLYVGTASSRESGASEPVLLRFTGRPNGGGSIEARLESTTRSWKRPLRGFVLTNARRSGGRPIVLRTASGEAVEDAPPTSVLGTQEDLELRLGLDSGSLAGEDERFSYQLAVAGAPERRRMAAEGEERARRFLGAFRSGITFDGILHEEQGFVTGGRLEIVRIDRRTGSVSARIRSVSEPGVFRELLGTCDPAGGSVMLDTTGRGVLDTGDDFNLPLFKSAASAAVHLDLTGSSITGGIEGDPSWVFEFPAGAFLSVPTEGQDPDSPPADGGVFPAFPKAPGAYLLAQGAWSALPTNLGHVVVETEGPKSEFQLPANFSAAVEKGLDEIAKQKEKRKASYLRFDGTDPRPVSSGLAIVVLFVGGQAQAAPVLELAPAETTKDGKRRVEVMGGLGDKVRFGYARLSAYVREVAPGCIMLTTTSALAPGPYVLNADRGYELTQE